jgi:hypothetical protein
VFASGVLMIVTGLAMAVAAAAIPDDAARPGLIVGGLAVGLSGALLAYISAPSRRSALAPGMARGKATILDATATAGAVAGYALVELTLEVRPTDGLPFQVKRKFSAGRIGSVEQGQTIDVVYDPADPQRVELG